MTDYQYKYYLDTPLGTLNFNDLSQWKTQGSNWVEVVTGLEAGASRLVAVNRPAKDGAILLPNAPRGPFMPVFTVAFLAPTLAMRHTLQDNCRAYLDSIRQTAGTLRWYPPQWATNGQGANTGVQLDVKLLNAHVLTAHRNYQIGAANIFKQVQFGLISTSSWFLATAQSSATGASPLSCPNGGTVATWPTITVAGASTNPTVTNSTTGATLAFTGTVAGGKTLTIDMLNETALLNDGTQWIGNVSGSTSQFWTLAPGANSITFSGGGTWTVTWRDTWV